jgi:acid phosphatase type 7
MPAPRALLRSSRRTRVAVTAIALTTAATAFAPAASGQTRATLVPASGAPGTQTTLTGAGFEPGARVAIRLGRKAVASRRASRGGSFSLRVTMRKGLQGRARVISTSRRKKVVNFFRVSYATSEPGSIEVALSNGTRLRTAPYQASVGSDVGLRGTRFPARRRVRVRFGAVAVGGGRSSSRGRFSQRLLVPDLPTGAHRITVRTGSQRLSFPFTVTPDPLIAAAGDIACDPESPFFNRGLGTPTECHMRQTSDLVLAARPSAVLALGDTQYEAGTPIDYQASYQPTWGRFKSITRPVLGNHEYGHRSGGGYFDYFGAVAGEEPKGYYSFDVGSWHLVALNSNCTQPGVNCAKGFAQERWLRADLGRHRETCMLAYMHDPLFSSGQEGGHPTVRELVVALYEAGVDVVLAASDHDYERFARQTPDGQLDPARGIRQFVVGTGGRDLQGFKRAKPWSEARNADTYGVLTLQLHPRSYDWEFRPEAGRSFRDSGSQACH